MDKEVYTIYRSAFQELVENKEEPLNTLTVRERVEYKKLISDARAKYSQDIQQSKNPEKLFTDLVNTYENLTQYW